MPEYRVRFVGDLGNLGQFNASIRNALASNSRILSQANSNVVSRSIGQPVVPASSNAPGFTIRNAITEIDKFNNAIVQSGQVVNRYIQDYTTGLNSVGRFEAVPVFGETFHTDFKKAIANAEQYAQVVARLAPVEQRINQIQKTGAEAIAQRQNAAIGFNLLREIPRNQRYDPSYDDVYKEAFQLFQGATGGAGFRLPTFKAMQVTQSGALKDLGASEDLADPFIQGERQLIRTGSEAVKTWTDLKRAVIASGGDIESTFARILGNIAKTEGAIQNSVATRIENLRNLPSVKALEGSALYAAGNPGGYIGEQSAKVLAQYPNIREDLIKKTGLGLQQPYQIGGNLNQNFFQAAEQQQFQVTSVTRDMERGLTNIRGSLVDSTGLMTEFTYAIDKNGNEVNSWGRKLSGSRGFLTETTRNLIKVVEWTVATTVVFGALGTAIGSVSKINELNVNLQRFAITARLSKTELDGLFKGLGRVAFNTATPITELVKAADDMALATRRANQTTQEWQQSILELANAVGILTNISGLDTVRATDLLVASMKQLNLTTKDLVPLLSQITAAGGGQANAITDIATGLSGLAEAAEQARIPLTGQIAAIQVISQITGKSADQTANAFKNLFGAINSDASVKKLAEFGIAVRDLTTGDLRPFLDIYKDIADKIKSGVIPQGRVNEILRAISGGRTGRQADAAALLANIYKVFEVQGVAANASNEALIANAKILDTNQAKITRFQNAFDISVYERFSEAIKNLTGALVDLGTIFSGIFGLVPTPFATMAIEVTALATAFTLLGKAASALGLAKLFNTLRGNTLGPGGIAGLFGGGLKFTPQIGASSRIAGSGLLGLLPIATQELLLNRHLAAGGAPAQYLFSNAGSGLGTFTSRDFHTETAPTQYNDLRTAAGLRPVPTYSSYRSPFVERDPLLDLPLIGVPSAPYGELKLTSAYQNGSLQYKNQFGPIRYVGGQYPELTRDQVPGINNIPGPNGPISTTSYVPGAIITSAKEIDRRLGEAAESGISRGLLSGVGKFLRGRGGLAVAGAAGTAAAGAAAGANGSDISDIGLLVGTSLLFTPAAPLGVGITAVSAGLKLLGDQQKQAAATNKELQNSLYDLTQQWKQDSASVSAAQDAYNIIQRSLRGVSSDTQQYIDLQGQLGEATVNLALAQDAQAGSTGKIIDTLRTLGRLNGNDALSKYAQGFIGKNLNANQLKEIVGLVSEQILGASGQPVYRPTTGLITPQTLNGTQTNNDFIPVPSQLIPFTTDKINPQDFALDPQWLQKFLGPGIYGGTNLSDNNFFTKDKFPFQNPAAVSAFQTALETQRQSITDPKQQTLFVTNVINPFNEAVAKFADAASQINLSVSSTRADVEARKLLGLLTGTDPTTGFQNADIADANIGAAERLQRFINSPTAHLGEGYDRESRTQLGGVNVSEANNTILGLTANAISGTFDPKLFKTAADESLKALGVFGQFPDKVSLVTAEAKILRDEFGLTDDEIIKVTGSLGNLQTAASEALDTAKQKTEEWSNSQLQNIGSQLVDLQARIQGGEFDKNPKLKNAMVAQLEALQLAVANATPEIDSLTEATLAFEDALGAEGADKAAQSLLVSLNALQINGFQGVEGSIDAVNTAFLGLLTRLNLSGPQIAAVVAKWVQVLALAAKAAAIAQQIASLPNLTGSGYTGGPASLANFNGYTSYTNQYNALLKEINAILKTGKGTGSLIGGTGTGTKATSDTLYLSEEQQKVADPLALVKQAYADALKLQSQIPGATKANSKNTVYVIDELQKIFTARGVSEELLRRALDNLTSSVNAANQKADTVKRIRVGAGDFSAIANVPLNSSTGVSVAGNNQINITFNLGGTNLTPAQFNLFANKIAAEIARRL